MTTSLPYPYPNIRRTKTAGLPTLRDGEMALTTDGTKSFYVGLGATNYRIWPLTLGDTIAGATPYRVLALDGGHNLTELAGLGATGDVLTSGGAGALPTFQAPAGGASVLPNMMAIASLRV